MSIVSFESYRTLTKDYDTEGADLERYLTLAQSLLETRLHRQFDLTEVVDEEVTVHYNERGYYIAYPIHMPVITVQSSGWEVLNTGALKTGHLGSSIVFNLSTRFANQYVTNVSYTGGYTDDTAPKLLQAAISQLAKAFIDSLDSTDAESSSIPTEVTQVKVGGLSASVGDADDSTLETMDIPENVWNMAVRFRRVRV